MSEDKPFRLEDVPALTPQAWGKRFWFWRGVQRTCGPLLTLSGLVTLGGMLGSALALAPAPLSLLLVSCGTGGLVAGSILAIETKERASWDTAASENAHLIDTAGRTSAQRKGMAACLSFAFTLALSAGGTAYFAAKNTGQKTATTQLQPTP